MAITIPPPPPTSSSSTIVCDCILDPDTLEFDNQYITNEEHEIILRESSAIVQRGKRLIQRFSKVCIGIFLFVAVCFFIMAIIFCITPPLMRILVNKPKLLVALVFGAALIQASSGILCITMTHVFGNVVAKRTVKHLESYLDDQNVILRTSMGHQCNLIFDDKFLVYKRGQTAIPHILIEQV